MNTFDIRCEEVSKMNDVIRCINDENCYQWWIHTVPDNAGEDDFEYIGSHDNEYEDVYNLYCNLFKKYIGSGLYRPSNIVVSYAMKTAKALGIKSIEVIV